MRFSEGDKLGRYVVEARIGEGAMGEVYRARDTRLGRRVALKVLHLEADFADDAHERESSRVLQEARAAATLSHPGIVAIFDVGEIDGTAFIAMELVEGKPLRELIGGDVPLNTRVGILCDIARALAAAHGAGLEHRDVKPENVFVLGDGSIKMLDFGLSKRVELDVDGARRSYDTLGDGSFAGTPAYMAPEQLKGEPTDARADQFAFGVVAYELLAGRLPFRSEKGPMSLISSILGDDPEPLAGLPDGLSPLVMRALEKEPDRRFASMADLVAALEPLAQKLAPLPLPGLSQLPAAARTTTTTRRRTAPPRRSRWAIPLVAALAALACVGAFFVLRPPPPKAGLPLLREAFPAPAPTPITGLPLPHSSSQEALQAYREGLQAMRDGSWLLAYPSFSRATGADPSLAGAWMRMALIMQSEDIPLSRENYRKAALHRGNLSERDRDFLEGVRVLVQGVGGEGSEVLARLALLRGKYPGDAEIAGLFAMHTSTLRPPEEGLAALDRCLALDPQYGDCLQGRARVLMQELSRFEEGMEVLDRCIEATPSASDCYLDKTAGDMFLGRADQLEKDARAWIVKNPKNPVAHAMLASAFYAQDERSAQVEPAMESSARLYEERGVPADASRRRIEVSIAKGRFAEAERRLHDYAKDLGGNPDLSMQAWVTYTRILLFEEMGRARDAGLEADSFFARKSAMLPGTTGFFKPELTMRFWRAKLDGGLVNREKYEAERAVWTGKVDGKGNKISLRAWMYGYGLVAANEQEGKAALEKFPPTFEKDKPFFILEYGVNFAAALGNAYFRAGDPASALPHLEAEAKACRGLWDPILHTQIVHELGLAKEALGDRAGACTAYARVLRRWGEAESSRTAEDARARSKALECEERG